MNFRNKAKQISAGQMQYVQVYRTARLLREKRRGSLLGLIPCRSPFHPLVVSQHARTHAHTRVRALLSLNFSPPPDIPGPFTLPLCTCCSLCLQSPSSFPTGQNVLLLPAQPRGQSSLMSSPTAPGVRTTLPPRDFLGGLSSTPN